MSWVALGSAAIAAVGSVAAADAKAQAAGGGAAPGISQIGAYGNTLGNDGWIVNLRGTQIGASASPAEATGGAEPAAAVPAMQATSVLPMVAFGGALLLLALRKGGK